MTALERNFSYQHIHVSYLYRPKVIKVTPQTFVLKSAQKHLNSTYFRSVDHIPIKHQFKKEIPAI
jgi:hypothetical protein